VESDRRCVVADGVRRVDDVTLAGISRKGGTRNAHGLAALVLEDSPIGTFEPINRENGQSRLPLRVGITRRGGHILPQQWRLSSRYFWHLVIAKESHGTVVLCAAMFA
jgi:hypothetical protein